MNYVYDSTEDFPVAANPLAIEEGQEQLAAKTAKSSKSKKSEESIVIGKEKVTGQKRSSAKEPQNPRAKKNKLSVVAESAEGSRQ